MLQLSRQVLPVFLAIALMSLGCSTPPATHASEPVPAERSAAAPTSPTVAQNVAPAHPEPQPQAQPAPASTATTAAAVVGPASTAVSTAAPAPAASPAPAPEPPPVTQPVNHAKPVPAPTASGPVRTADTVVALVNGKPITMKQLEKPLVEAYGLNVLLQLIQLELARQDAASAKVTVTQDDINHERLMTIEQAFPDAEPGDYDQLLEQLLQTQHLTKPQFEIAIETNAYLRKIAEPGLKDRITDQNIEQAFNAIYGENVVVRHIQTDSVQDAMEARRRVLAGEPFEKVAEEMSRNAKTRVLGGQMPPFTREAANISDAFKRVAFDLKIGDVSDPVESNGSFHIIKLEQRIPPKVVKLDDEIRKSVRERLYNGLVQQTIKELRAQLGRQAMQVMKIEDPVLKKQFEDRMSEQAGRGKEEKDIRKDFAQRLKAAEQRAATQRAALQAATAASTRPATNASTQPSTQEAGGRPPATTSGHDSHAPDAPTPATTTTPSVSH